MSGEDESKNTDIKPYWESRLEEAKDEGGIYVEVTVHRNVRNSLTPEESEWLETRMQTVERAATKMAYNMFKGVVKYKEQGRDLESWMKHWLDDATDNFAYTWLVAESIERTLGISADGS